MGNATTKHSQKIKDPNARALVGQKIMYIGSMTCPTCGTPKKRGMVSRYNEVLYCGEGCIPAGSNA